MLGQVLPEMEKFMVVRKTSDQEQTFALLHLVARIRHQDSNQHQVLNPINQIHALGAFYVPASAETYRIIYLVKDDLFNHWISCEPLGFLPKSFVIINYYISIIRVPK